MNCEASILIKVQCVVYQWICLDKLYKLMGIFFSNFKFVFLLAIGQKLKIFEQIARREY